MKNRLLTILAALSLAAFAGLLLLHGRLLSAETPGRVEVLCGGELALLEAAAERMELENVSREGDRLILDRAGQYSGQILAAGVLFSGGDKTGLLMLDYSWADEVLEQSIRLWRIPGAALLLWLLCRCIRRQAALEWERMTAAQEQEYLPQYLDRAAVRLLAKAIVLVLMIFFCIWLLRWLWQLPVMLPPDLLPEGSLFQREHYRQWAAGLFSGEVCSAYGTALQQQLKTAHLLAALECLCLLFPAVWAARGISGGKMARGQGVAAGCDAG